MPRVAHFFFFFKDFSFSFFFFSFFFFFFFFLKAATALASSLFMLHTMLHHAAVSKNFAFDLQGWLEHANGLNVDESGSPGDFDEGMLVDAFANVRDQEFVFQDGGSSNTPQVQFDILLFLFTFFFSCLLIFSSFV